MASHDQCFCKGQVIPLHELSVSPAKVMNGICGELQRLRKARLANPKYSPAEIHTFYFVRIGL